LTIIEKRLGVKRLPEDIIDVKRAKTA
jgi:hypothetical protein